MSPRMRLRLRTPPGCAGTNSAEVTHGPTSPHSVQEVLLGPAEHWDTPVVTAHTATAEPLFGYKPHLPTRAESVPSRKYGHFA